MKGKEQEPRGYHPFLLYSNWNDWGRNRLEQRSNPASLVEQGRVGVKNENGNARGQGDYVFGGKGKGCWWLLDLTLVEMACAPELETFSENRMKCWLREILSSQLAVWTTFWHSLRKIVCWVKPKPFYSSSETETIWRRWSNENWFLQLQGRLASSPHLARREEHMGTRFMLNFILRWNFIC